LNYQLAVNSFGQSSFLLKEIRQFHNIESLLVGYYCGHVGLGATLDGEALSAVFDIMKGRHFKTLVLDSVRGFPVEFIRGAPGMRELVLRGHCSSIPGDGPALLPAP
jgi:hypothetical protein